MAEGNVNESLIGILNYVKEQNLPDVKVLFMILNFGFPTKTYVTHFDYKFRGENGERANYCDLFCSALKDFAVTNDNSFDRRVQRCLIRSEELPANIEALLRPLQDTEVIDPIFTLSGEELGRTIDFPYRNLGASNTKREKLYILVCRFIRSYHEGDHERWVKFIRWLLPFTYKQYTSEGLLDTRVPESMYFAFKEAILDYSDEEDSYDPFIRVLQLGFEYMENKNYILFIDDFLEYYKKVALGTLKSEFVKNDWKR